MKACSKWVGRSKNRRTGAGLPSATVPLLMSGGWLGNSGNAATGMASGPNQSVTSSVNCMKWCVQLDMFSHQAWIHEAEQRGQKATERSFLTAAKRTLALANAPVNESPPSGEAWTNAAWMATQEKESWELSCPSALGCRSWWQPRRKLEKKNKAKLYDASRKGTSFNLQPLKTLEEHHLSLCSWFIPLWTIPGLSGSL